MTLTIAMITARHEPKFEWFLDSLSPQINESDEIDIIIVDGTNRPTHPFGNLAVLSGLPHPTWNPIAKKLIKHHAAVHPTIWQGEHRITKEDWWAVAAARNTAICLCRTDYIVFLDDRCVLTDTWLESVRRAMAGNYAIAGSYEKRHNMVVENGVITSMGTLDGQDHRTKRGPCAGGWFFGCSCGLPLEWALEMGGYPEDACDGHGGEDCMFGKLLENTGHAIRFEPDMKVIQDRTPGECGPVMRKEDRGVSPRDLSHRMVELFNHYKNAHNSFDIRAVRNDVLQGKPWPMPTASHTCWFSGENISEWV